MADSSNTEGRCALYRLLADPSLLRLLALVAQEELTIGELAELLDESQSSVSRQAASLRLGGLVSERRFGTRSYVRLGEAARRDPVVGDAVAEGVRLCTVEGRLARIEGILGRREGRHDTMRSSRGDAAPPMTELPVYVRILSTLTGPRVLVVVATSSDPSILDAVAPSFRRVVVVDPSASRLKRMEQWSKSRGYDNVEFVCAEFEDRESARRVTEGATIVLVSRVLHLVPAPSATVAALAALLAPGGEIVLIEHEARAGEETKSPMRDVTRGIAKAELLEMTRGAGLVDASWTAVPAGYVRGCADGSTPWQIVRAMRPPVAKGGGSFARPP